MAKKKPDSQLTDLQTEILDLQDKYKRSLADYQNLEKRHQTDRQQTLKYAAHSILDKLLPVIDDLERAAHHIKDTGLTMILNQLNQVLKSENVTPIDPLGQDFDPLTMDCLEVVNGPQNKVITVHSKGYLYHDRVLRPAKVEVGNGHQNVT